MPTLPTEHYVDKHKGALTKTQWKELVSRIPATYHHNPFYALPDDQLPLAIVPLDEFLKKHQGKAPAILFSHHLLIYPVPAYAGRHPCIVDNIGRALFFVDESTAVLKGTGQQKSRPRKVNKKPKEVSDTPDSSESERPVRPAPRPARQRLPSPDEIEAPPDDTVPVDHPVIEKARERLLLAARRSPSGHINKRPRTDSTTDSTVLVPDSAEQSADDRDQRPFRPLPRTVSKDLKRKHADVASSGPRGFPTTHRFQPQLQQPAGRPPHFRTHMGPGPAEGIGRAAQYHPSFHQQPFAPPHPYPHEGYMPPIYGHHTYPPQYGPPAWGPAPQHPREQWPAGPSRFNPEDRDPYNPQGHRNYAP